MVHAVVIAGGHHSQASATKLAAALGILAHGSNQVSGPKASALCHFISDLSRYAGQALMVIDDVQVQGFHEANIA